MKEKTNHNHTEDIICELRVAYAMELETVQNYIANAVHLDGVRSEVVKKELAADVPVKWPCPAIGASHQDPGRTRARLAGTHPTQTYLQPPEDQTNVPLSSKA